MAERCLIIDDTPYLRVPLQGRVPTMQLRRLLVDAGRDVSRCERCGAGSGLQIHHLRSLARGGTNEPANLAVLCTACHDLIERESGPSGS